MMIWWWTDDNNKTSYNIITLIIMVLMMRIMKIMTIMVMVMMMMMTMTMTMMMMMRMMMEHLSGKQVYWYQVTVWLDMKGVSWKGSVVDKPAGRSSALRQTQYYIKDITAWARERLWNWQTVKLRMISAFIHVLHSISAFVEAGFYFQS